MLSRAKNEPNKLPEVTSTSPLPPLPPPPPPPPPTTTTTTTLIHVKIKILCRRSGLYMGDYYGSGTGQIWLDDLRCTGSETSFVNCTHGGWGVHNCDHSKDVSILCGNGTLFETLFSITFLLSLYSVSKKIPPKDLGIFQPNFTCLLCVHIYARVRIFIQLSATLTKLCLIKRDKNS